MAGPQARLRWEWQGGAVRTLRTFWRVKGPVLQEAGPFVFPVYSQGTMSTDTLKALFDAVQTRPRPEDVAELIEAVLPLGHGEKAVLGKASKNSLRKLSIAYGTHYSSMAADFSRPRSAEKQVGTAAAVFKVEPLTAAECLSPERVTAWVSRLGETISHVFGDKTRLTRAQRREVGIFKVQRWYNKRWRILRNLEDKIERLAWESRKYTFTRVGKSALATKIRFEDFAADLPTACLVAYLSARMSVRSVFTNTSQDRAFDEIAEMLLKKCEANPDSRWDVIAHVSPQARILKRLSDEQKGRLLGAWWDLMMDMADMLKIIWERSAFDRRDMIVSRGNDSSSWNQVAGGWNKARENWVSLVHALGFEGMLTEVCPGKVMRLMAADVARWHRSSGGGVHPDTAVWADLPAPWEVIRGEKSCTREYVELVCGTHGVDPEKWTSFKKDQRAVAFKPTPELVHGVVVSNPYLATALRKAGVFSGKGLRDEVPDFAVKRDENGFALRAVPAGVE